jgi:uroporphyrinogen-III synthase
MAHPRVVITRPAEEAARLVPLVEALGAEAVLAPMLEIVPLEPPPALALEGVQAILATSANGVSALATALGPPPRERALPLLCVGEASAAAARDAGFHAVRAAAGDVETLAALTVATCDPRGGRLLHVAGTVLAGDLKGALEAAGFAVERAVLYEARAACRLPPALGPVLDDTRPTAVLFFSPRSAATFVTVLAEAGLAEVAARLVAVCLSEAVAAAAAALAWRRIAVAARPVEAALIEALAEVLGAPPRPPSAHAWDDDG